MFYLDPSSFCLTREIIGAYTILRSNVKYLPYYISTKVLIGLLVQNTFLTRRCITAEFESGCSDLVPLHLQFPMLFCATDTRRARQCIAIAVGRFDTLKDQQSTQGFFRQAVGEFTAGRRCVSNQICNYEVV